MSDGGSQETKQENERAVHSKSGAARWILVSACVLGLAALEAKLRLRDILFGAIYPQNNTSAKGLVFSVEMKGSGQHRCEL